MRPAYRANGNDPAVLDSAYEVAEVIYEFTNIRCFHGQILSYKLGQVYG